jgi:hypothetical protein
MADTKFESEVDMEEEEEQPQTVNFLEWVVTLFLAGIFIFIFFKFLFF